MLKNYSNWCQARKQSKLKTGTRPQKISAYLIELNLYKLKPNNTNTLSDVNIKDESSLFTIVSLYFDQNILVFPKYHSFIFLMLTLKQE